MTIATCLHPNCNSLLKRNQVCCGKHWGALHDDLRRRINKASRYDPSELGALKVEAIEYFESRLIGDHEIVTCRGKDCGADMVFLLSKKGKKTPVNADTVEPDDVLFEYGRHVHHRATCPNTDDFPRSP